MSLTVGNTLALRKQRDICTVPCFDNRKVRAVRSRLAKQEDRLRTQAGSYKLLGNTTRLKILFALADTELCVCDIAHVLGLSIAATSHQLKLLHGQNWLQKRNDGKMLYYRLNDVDLVKALERDVDLLNAGAA